MEEKNNKKEENYDFIYEDYLDAKKGDPDDMIFSSVQQDKTQSEK
ncbi:MAG: hypothetical protein WCX81_03105 [Monoglobales bacterium]